MRGKTTKLRYCFKHRNGSKKKVKRKIIFIEKSSKLRLQNYGIIWQSKLTTSYRVRILIRKLKCSLVYKHLNTLKPVLFFEAYAAANNSRVWSANFKISYTRKIIRLKNCVWFLAGKKLELIWSHNTRTRPIPTRSGVKTSASTDRLWDTEAAK